MMMVKRIEALFETLPSKDDKGAFLYDTANDLGHVYNTLAACFLRGKYDDELCNALYSVKFIIDKSDCEADVEFGEWLITLSDESKFDSLTEEERIKTAKKLIIMATN